MKLAEIEEIIEVKPPPAAKPAVEAINILIVDDENRNLDALELILTQPDLRIVRAQNAEVALLALMHQEFACLILDIQMPSMSGLELARLIKTRKRNQHIPIIFLTAYFLDEKDILQGYGAGAVDYLTKPVNSQILKSKVGVFMDLFRATRALAAANHSLEQEIAQRKNAEEALRQSNSALEMRVQERTEELSLSEKRYRQVVSNLPAAIYTTDAHGRMTFFNDAAVELWGRAPEIGKDLWCGSYKIFRPDGNVLSLDECPMALTLKTGVPIRGEEIVIERPDGTRRNVLPYPTPIHDSLGKITGAVNMLLDITERNLAQLVSQRFAAIVESSDDAIVSKDVNGIINSWNHGAERIFQYKAAEIIGKPVTTLIPLERHMEEEGILSRVRRGERVKHFETIRMRKDGSLIDVSLAISPIKDFNGKIIGAAKIARNITERKTAERQQHALYELVATVNCASSLTEVCDAALEAIFQCQSCSRASILLRNSEGVMRFKTWRGLSDGYRCAVEGHSPWKVDDPSPQPIFINDIAHSSVDEPLLSVIKGEGIVALAFIPITYEDRLLGKFMIYFNTAHQFSLEELRPTQTIASQIAFAIERQRVLNELKRAHNETLAASQAKDHFLATLSHELRTPLNPVLLMASDAAGNPSLPASVRADFDMIRKNVELEARLIDDLLDLTRITRGKILLKKEFHDTHSILQDAVATVLDEIEQKKIILILKLDANQRTIFADAVRLQQVFWNVLKNAVKFTPQNGRIIIETGMSDDRTLSVKITDTGIGMNAEEIGRLFSAFSQGDHASGATSNRFGGLGLGLAISQKLLELHSGRIQAASAGRDQGSVFTIELPLASRAEINGTAIAPMSPMNASGSALNANRVRILLVEDHEPTRTTLAHLLARRRYNVVTAGSIAEAKTLAEKQNFNLLISDIGLPDGDGYELMRKLRKNGLSCGIALTGYGMEQDLARSHDAGFIAHLIKPVGVQSLEAALSAAIKSIENQSGG